MTSKLLRTDEEPNRTVNERGERLDQPHEETGMPLETANELTAQERDIVALGASVGSGCHPCVTYHVDASRKAGLSNDQMSEIVVRAHRVAVVAADRIVREGLRLAQAASDEPAAQVAAERANELAALGAAIAANSMADIEKHVAGAMRAGLSVEKLTQAASVAHEVQANAASIHARKTARLLKQRSEDDSSARQPLVDIGSPLVGATDDDHPADPGYAKDVKVATDATAPSAECEDDCACHDEAPSQQALGARGHASAGGASDGSRADDAAGAPGASMLAMMGGNAATSGNCCAPAVPQELHENAEGPAKPGCNCTSDSPADDLGQL